MKTWISIDHESLWSIQNIPSSASRKGCKKRSNSISSIADITSPALRVFLFAFIAKLFALVSTKQWRLHMGRLSECNFSNKTSDLPRCCVENENTGCLRYRSSCFLGHVYSVWQLKTEDKLTTYNIANWLQWRFGKRQFTGHIYMVFT